MGDQRCDNGETSLPYQEVDWSLNYRKHPEKYVIGRGQFGVLKYQPYKSEILPYWSFKNEECARKSVSQILELFCQYLRDEDFPGADMAKKYLHMGNTRSLRYAKYPGGKKYIEGEEREPLEWADEQKWFASRVFKKGWDIARTNELYLKMKEKHKRIRK